MDLSPVESLPMQPASLLGLPAEILDQILSYLHPIDVALIAQTSVLLSKHASKDALWHGFVQERVPTLVTCPAPLNTWRELYAAHYTHWFLATRKIWFSDMAPHGKLVIARYDQRRGCIEAYALAAQAGRTPVSHIVEWPWGPFRYVEVGSFDPVIQLDLNKPLVSITSDTLVRQSKRLGSTMVTDVNMDINARLPDHLNSAFLLTRNLPSSLLDERSSVWPPLSLPSPGNQRTRNSSGSDFRASGHAPTKLSEISNASFRLRITPGFDNFFLPEYLNRSMPPLMDRVDTFGTLPPEAYTPTAEKPWQGIWCGDYSSHGCEFLLLTQPDDPGPLPEKAQFAMDRWPDCTPWQSLQPGHGEPPTEELEALVADTNTSRRDTNIEKGGRLEAIKLTGDPNVPRADITFIAEDLGPRGFVRHVRDPVFNTEEALNDPEFEGARAVRCCGHISAARIPRRESYVSRILAFVVGISTLADH